jgi:glutathione synthase/RimK-type ligase-like ATP-grasp enzyme
MLNSQRVFVEAIKAYCADHDIAVELRADGWLIIMRRGERRHFAFGYDIGLNSAVAHKIANDKSATADVLEMAGIACVAHAVFLNPQLNAFIPPAGSWEAMLKLLEKHPSGIVVKPNDGTSGKSVFFVSTKPALELAVNRIFASHLSLAISPYLAIEDEVRVVLIDDVPAVVYEKSRPAIVGDGRHSLLELALTTLSVERRSTVLPGMLADLDKAELDAIPPAGQRRVLNWRHNLESGAQPKLLAKGGVRDTCVRLALSAAQAIGIRFASVDLVRVGKSWQVLEVNSGVMMESLARHHPDLVHSVYRAALDKAFGAA